MNFTPAQILVWLQQGLSFATAAGVLPASSAEIAAAVLMGYNAIRANLSERDRSALDAQAIAVFRAKGVSLVARNDVLAAEFSDTIPLLSEPPS